MYMDEREPVFDILKSGLMPQSSYEKKATPSFFAVILNDGASLCESDILDILRRERLRPLFFDVSRATDREILKRRARAVGARIIKPHTYDGFFRYASDCAFAVSEELCGAVLSFLSHTPVYVDASRRECRELVALFSRVPQHTNVIMPYTKNRTRIIKRKAEAPSSDLSEILKSLLNAYL